MKIFFQQGIILFLLLFIICILQSKRCFAQDFTIDQDSIVVKSYEDYFKYKKYLDSVDVTIKHIPVIKKLEEYAVRSEIDSLKYPIFFRHMMTYFYDQQHSAALKYADSINRYYDFEEYILATDRRTIRYYRLLITTEKIDRGIKILNQIKPRLIREKKYQYLVTIYNSLAYTYEDEKALFYLWRSLTYANKMENPQYSIVIRYNLGEYYLNTNQKDCMLYHLEYNRKIDPNGTSPIDYENILGAYYLKNNLIDSARIHAQKGYEGSIKINDTYMVRWAAKTLMKIAYYDKNYQKTTNLFNSHFVFDRQFIGLFTYKDAKIISESFMKQSKSDSAMILSDLAYKKLMEQKVNDSIKYFSDFDQSQLIQESQKINLDNQVSKVTIENQKKTLLITIIGSVLIVAALIFSFFQMKKLRLASKTISSQKTLLEKEKKNVDQSINAALHIQKAILPKNNLVYKYLSGFEIFYQPRDIVSGDYYWAKEKCIDGDNTLYIALVDCTGHGVPGAFVSMISNSVLLESINRIQTQDGFLNLMSSISKYFENNFVNNTEARIIGKDMGIISVLNKEDKSVIQFCGAKIDLYVWNKVSEKMYVYKGTRRGIGGTQNLNKEFINYSIDVNQGDRLYLFSDGLPDQDNVNGNFLRKKNLVQYLEDTASLDIETQKKSLKNFVNKWMGSAKQLDDILVLLFEI